jgi:uncharacterized membrane protein required for colicin V production
MTWSAVDKTSATTPWWQNLSFSWFDFVLLCILAFGFWRGRKHGMSREALPTSMWLIAIIGAGFACQPLGEMLNKTGYVAKVFGSGYNQLTMSKVVCYLGVCFVVFIINSFLKKIFKEKLAGSNAFGSGEYYLGITSGMIRYTCITIFFLALLNAPFYSSAEIVADKAFKNRWFGGGMKDFNGDFFPSVYDVQSDVFKKSFTGKAIKELLEPILIPSAAPAKKTGGKK